MKKIALLLASLCLIPTLACAQNSWTEGGLSEAKCQWMRIQLQVVEVDGEFQEVWKKCENAEANCIERFCSGPPETEGAAANGWKKENCNKYCITLQEQLPIEGHKVRSISGDSGVDLLSNYFGMWYKFGALVLGLIAVLVIVISGVQISMGGASEEGVSAAKTRMMAAILSIILLFGSALILNTINPLFFT